MANVRFAIGVPALAAIVLSACSQQAGTIVPRDQARSTQQVLQVRSNTTLTIFPSSALVRQTPDGFTVTTSREKRAFPASASVHVVDRIALARRAPRNFVLPAQPCQECAPAGPPVNGPTATTGNVMTISWDDSQGLTVIFSFPPDGNVTWTMTAYDSFGSVGWDTGNMSGPGGGTGAMNWASSIFTNSPTNATVNFYNDSGQLIGVGHLHR